MPQGNFCHLFGITFVLFEDFFVPYGTIFALFGAILILFVHKYGFKGKKAFLKLKI